MAAVLGRMGLWRRLGVLLVLVLLASEIVVVGAGGGKSKNKNKNKKNKKKSGAKKKGAKKQHRGSGELPERASGLAEADHLAYFEREISRALSGLDGTSGHANAALPKPISIVPQEALMAALLQAKMGITGSSLIDAIGDTMVMPAPAGGSSGSDTERSIHPELMVLGDSGWQPVHIGLVGNWTRHGFRCHGHAGEYPQKPNDPVAGRDVINATLAECQRTCQELRLCHYYSHRAADASDTGSGDVTRGNCELYSAEPTSALSKAVGGQPSAQDKSKGLSEKQTASRGDLQPEGEKSSLAQVDRCVVDLSGCSHPDAPDSSCLYTAGESTVNQRATASQLQQLFGGQGVRPMVNANAEQELALVGPMTHKERLAAALTHFGKTMYPVQHDTRVRSASAEL